MLRRGVVVAVTLGDPAGTVLVLRALGLGDLLTGIPALRGLRRAFPAAWVVLATRADLAPLAKFCGAVDDVVPTAGLGELRWDGPSPELAVNLHGSGPESIADLIITRPKLVISHRNPSYPDLCGPPWRDEVHEVDRWCGLLGSAGISCDPEDLGLGRPAGYPYRRDVVVIHPGAAYPSRRWPAERFAQVAAALHSSGHGVVVTGSLAEKELAETVARQAGVAQSAVLAGELDVLGMVALITDCRLLICGDTGVGHIATATGTPSVLLFGPTPPSRWGPRGRGRHVAVWAGDCGDPHADHPHRGLLLITPSRVLAASRQILAEVA
ncbi:MAG: glycosyltransferase family 9 protein [Mycobacteriaceae bacterium]|nr:glycosyltransferase family 9 protein [Mycobacteriaceae bacterium]